MVRLAHDEGRPVPLCLTGHGVSMGYAHTGSPDEPCTFMVACQISDTRYHVKTCISHCRCDIFTSQRGWWGPMPIVRCRASVQQEDTASNSSSRHKFIDLRIVLLSYHVR